MFLSRVDPDLKFSIVNSIENLRVLATSNVSAPSFDQNKKYRTSFSEAYIFIKSLMLFSCLVFHVFC